MSICYFKLLTPRYNIGVGRSSSLLTPNCLGKYEHYVQGLRLTGGAGGRGSEQLLAAPGGRNRLSADVESYPIKETC